MVPLEATKQASARALIKTFITSSDLRTVVVYQSHSMGTFHKAAVPPA